jgi:lipid-A-disaccharide synthase-like uncharacterized protein
VAYSIYYGQVVITLTSPSTNGTWNVISFAGQAFDNDYALQYNIVAPKNTSRKCSLVWNSSLFSNAGVATTTLSYSVNGMNSANFGFYLIGIVY